MTTDNVNRLTIAIYARTRRDQLGNAKAGLDIASLHSDDAEPLGTYELPQDYTLVGDDIDSISAGILVRNKYGNPRMIVLGKGNTPMLRYVDETLTKGKGTILRKIGG